jgi:hypothetical protein
MKNWATIFLVLVMVSCAGPAPAVKKVTDDQAVYQAIFAYYESRTPVVREFSIYNGVKDVDKLYASYKDRVAKETIKSLLRANAKAKSLLKTFDGASEIRLITDKEIKEVRELYGVNIDESWKQFHRKYGESSWLVSLSRIGYNAGHTEAIVQSDMGYGPLAGEGL